MARAYAPRTTQTEDLMISAATALFRTDSALRGRLVRTYAALVAFNVIAWAITLLAATQYPILLPTAVLAYTFGLRHAVDADHIAAIDNTTRKLMQDGQRPVGVGLFFSLGHSTIVVAMSVLIAISAGFVSDMPAFQDIGSLIGTSVSAAFLLLIGVINLVVLIDIYRMFRQGLGGRRVRRADAGGLPPEPRPAGAPAATGAPPRSARAGTCIRSASCSDSGSTRPARWRCSASPRRPARPACRSSYILVLPALFAAGMSLVDTTDGVLMLGAYGWAYIKPIRKLYYNLNITLVSVLIAFLIGGIEVLSIVGERFGLTGGIWDLVGTLDFGLIGFGIIAIFVASWIISTLIYRWKGYDDLPTRPAPGASARP